MYLADHRNVGRDPGCGFVDRRQMVQVQDIRFSRTAKQKFTAPRIYLAFVVTIVKYREDHVWSAGSVLVGGMQRSVALPSVKLQRRVAGQRQVKAHRMRPAVEAMSVSMRTEVAT